MRESGPTSPKDKGTDQGLSAKADLQNDAFFDETEFETEAEPAEGEASEAPVLSHPRRTSDPVIQWLTIGIALVIIFWLVGVLSAMMFGVLSPAKAPRTSTERDLLGVSAAVQGGKADTQTYSRYVAILINSGQLAKAEQALNQALLTAKTDRSYLYARQADLYFARKDYQGAVTSADKAIAEAKKEIGLYMQANVNANRKPKAGLQTPASYTDAALVKAEALVASKNYAGAIKAFDLYLIEQPIDSDILVQRGQVKVLVGDKKGAEADFRAALSYIPDYQPALDGLKQIGAAK
jgi:tetratricopeptide (TPR) repeat protein